ncbi:MAG: outer membrane protein assembly factor BamD, partial [Bacteroidales bacterium]|nr:outer membrane protein assembly factor BamD [Bacteroidales bacterium]
MIPKSLKAIFFGCIALIISSCSNYQQLMKSSDYGEKYEMAVVYYNQGDYYRALELFETVLPFYRGSEKAEDLNYYYAYCHYHQRDYELASHYFKRFAKNFPTSKYAEECQFMSARCKYKLSPTYSLDQTNTLDAINELQLFIDLYPKSERIPECNELIDQLR